jgi:hypothetical protein
MLIVSSTIVSERGKAGENICLTSRCIINCIQVARASAVLHAQCAALQVGQQTLVRSVPGELSTNKNEVLRLAQGQGYISKSQLMEVRLQSPQTDTLP